MEFLEKLETISSIVGALATAGACIIALWQTRIHTKHSLKLKVRLAFAKLPLGKIRPLLSLDIINNGYTKVIVKEWSIALLHNKKLVFTAINVLFGNVSLPQTLEPSTDICLYYSAKDLNHSLKESIKQGLLKPQAKLKFEVRDSLGNIYTVKSEFSAQKWIELTEKM